MSSKNRRKLLRKINVNDIQYFWCVVDYDCDGDGSSRFQIWKNKQKIFEKLICGETITPKIVREKILNIENEFDKLYPSEEILFISEDSLTKI